MRWHVYSPCSQFVSGGPVVWRCGFETPPSRGIEYRWDVYTTEQGVWVAVHQYREGRECWTPNWVGIAPGLRELAPVVHPDSAERFRRWDPKPRHLGGLVVSDWPNRLQVFGRLRFRCFAELGGPEIFAELVEVVPGRFFVGVVGGWSYFAPHWTYSRQNGVRYGLGHYARGFRSVAEFVEWDALPERLHIRARALLDGPKGRKRSKRSNEPKGLIL